MLLRGNVVTAVLVILSFFTQSVLCQTETPNARAKKYFDLLSTSPSGDYLYDRFYDAWLDTGSVAGLENFLKIYASENSSSASGLLLAFFYERQGKDAEAIKMFQQAATKDSGNADVLFQKARAEARILDFNTAIIDLTQAGKLSKNNELSKKIGKLLGQLYTRTAQKELAAQTWQKLIAAHPSDEDLYEDLIELQLSEGLYDEAVKTSDELLAKTKDNYKLIMRRLRKADIYQYTSKNEKALEIYTGAMELVGQDTWLENQIYYQIEQIFRKDDNIRGLKDYLDKIITAQPGRVSLKKRQGRLLLSLGQTEEALDLFREIIRITPGDKNNQKEYIDALKSVAQTDKAVELMKQLCTQNPNDKELLIELADLHYLNGDANSTIKTLANFLNSSDKSEYAFLRVIRLLERYEYEDKALEVFQKTLAAHPNSLTAKEAYADMLFRMKRKKEALELWDAIAKAGDMQTLLRVAQIGISHGYSESALKWLEDKYGQFENDLAYLNQLCETAIKLGLYNKARPWIQKQLQLADRFSLIQTAVRQMMLIEKNSNNINNTVNELKALKQRSIQQTCLLSEMLENQGASQEANSILDNVEEKDRQIALQQKIRLYSTRKQWDQAAECTRKLIETKGTQETQYVQDIINLYEKAGQPKKAMEWIPMWKKTSPGSTAPLLAESRLLQKLNQTNEAINKLRSADQKFEADKEILTELVSLYRSVNRLEEAQRIIWRLYDDAKDVSDKLQLVRDLALTGRSIGNQDAVLNKLLERKRDNRTSIVPCLALAEMYKQMNKYEQRRQMLLEATRLKPNDVSLMHEIAGIEESEGDWERAAETLRQAMQLDGTDKTRQKLAKLFIQYGDEDEGYKLLFNLRENKQIDPRDAQSTVELMIAGMNWSTAIDYLDEILPKFPNDYKLYYLYGTLLEEEGREADALDIFIKMLSMKTEIPGNTAVSILSQQSGSMSDIGKIMPPEAVATLEMVQRFQRVLSYRRQYNNLPYYYYSAGVRSSRSGSVYISGMPSSQQIIMPANIDDVSGFALAHIVSLGQSLGKENSDRIKSILAENNLSILQALLDSGQTNIDNIGQAISDAVQKYPQNENILALSAIYGSQNFTDTPDKARQTFNLLKPKYPRLAGIIGIQYGLQQTTASDVLVELVKIIKDINEPTGYEVSRYASALSSETNLLTEQQRTFLAEKLIEWHSYLGHSSQPNQSNYFYIIANAIARKSTLDRFISLLNAELENYRYLTSQNAQAGTAVASSGQVQVQDLPFPPAYLQDFPISITQFLFERGRNDPLILQRILDPNNIEEFITHINKMKEPLLRAVVLCAAGQEKSSINTLTDLIASEPNSISGHIFMASLLGRSNKKEQAIATLNKLEKLPLDKITQQLVDSAIVSYTLSLDMKTHPDELEIARQAALRLRSNQFSSQSLRDQFVKTLEQLGLADEARLLSRQVVSTQVTPGINSTIQGYPQQVQIQQQILIGPTTSSTTVNQMARINELFQKDKTDAALKLILSDLKLFAMSYLLPDRGNIQNSSEVIERVALVNARKATDKLLEMAEPGQSKSIRKLLEYARICDFLGQEDKAIQTYERILQLKPREFASGLWMAILTAKNDPNKATEYLMAIDRRYSSQAGQQLANYISNNYSQSISDSLNIVSLVATYLKTLDNTDNINLSWSSNILTNIANSYSRNINGINIRLPHLYSEPQTVNTTPVTVSPIITTGRTSTQNKDEQEELLKKRREVHNQLCRVMLDIPQLSQQGFACLYAEAKNRNAVDDEFIKIARDAVIKYKPYQNNISLTGLINSYSWGSGKDKRLISAWEFLLSESWKQHKLPALLEELTPVFEKDKRQNEAKQLKSLASLYLASNEQYITEAGNFLKSGMNIQTAMNYIIDIYSERSLSANLNQFLLDQAKLNIQNNSYYVQQYVQYYLNNLVKNNTKAARDFLDDVVTIYLGPKEFRRDLIEKNYDRTQRTNNPINQRIIACFQFLQEAAQNKELVFTVLTQYDSTIMSNSDMQYRVRNAFDNVISQGQQNGNTAALLEVLKTSPFLGDINSFKTLPVERIQNNSAYGYLLNRLWQNSGQQYQQYRTNVRDELSKLPAEFGTELLFAQLSQNRTQDVYECLGKYWDKISHSDPNQQLEISLMVADTIGTSLPGQNTSNTNAVQIYERLIQLRTEAGKAKTAAFLSKKQYEDFKIETYQFIEYVAGIISSVCSYDANSGMAILTRANDLVEDAKKRGKWSYSSSQSFAYDVFNRIDSSSRYSPGLLGLAVRVVRDTNNTNVEPYFIQRFQDSLYQKYRQYQSSGGDYEINAVKDIYNEIGPLLGKGNLSGITGIFQQIFNSGNWSEQKYTTIINWLYEQINTGQYTNLAQEMVMNAIYARQQRFNRGGETNSFAEIKSYYQGVLTDSNLPLQWRLMTFYAINQQFSNLNSNNDFVFYGIDLLQQGWSQLSELSPDYYTNNSILSRFVQMPRNESWNQAAAELAKAYMAFRQRPAPASGSSGMMSRYTSNPQIQLPMLRIILTLNQAENASKMLDGFDSAAGSYLDCWAMLVEYNQKDILQSVISKQWQNNINQYNMANFNAQVETNLSNCLDGLQSPDMRYFAEVMISSMQDGGNVTSATTTRTGTTTGRVVRTPDSGNPTSVSKRTERLSQLAKKFGEITFSSDTIRQKVLEAFIKDDKILPLVSEHLAKEAQSINLSLLAVQSNSSSIQTQSNILTAYNMARLLDGDPNAFINTIRQLSPSAYGGVSSIGGSLSGRISSSSYSSGARNILNSLTNRLVNYVQQNDFQTSWTIQHASALASVTTELLKLPESVSSYGYQLAPNFVVFHILANRDDEIDTQYDSFSSETKQRLSSYNNISQLCQTLARYVNQRNRTLQQRLEIIGRFFQSNFVQDVLNKNNQRDITSLLTNYNLLSRQEVEANGALLKDLFVQKKQITQFLQATKFEDFNIKPEESTFSQYVSGLLNSTMWQDANLCSKILVKADSLAKQAKAAGQWTNTTNNDDFISSILSKRDYQSFSVADLGIVTALTRDANGPQLVISPDYLQRIYQVTQERYRQLISSPTRIESVKKFYELVGPYFGKGSAAGFAELWRTILQTNIRNQQETDSVIEWTNQQKQTGDYPKLAGDIYISALQSGRTTPPQMQQSPTAEQIKIIKDYYLQILADSELSYIWRLMAIQNIVKSGKLEDYPDVVLKSIPVIIAAWKQYSYLPNAYYDPFVLRFVQLQNEPGWAELAGKLSEAYKQYMEKTGIKKSTSPIAQSNTGTSSEEIALIQVDVEIAQRQAAIIRSSLTGGTTTVSRGGARMGGGSGMAGSRGYTTTTAPPTNNSPSDDSSQKLSLATQKAMLELWLITNQDELIKEQVENCDQTFGSSLDVWVILAQYGKDSLLAPLIEKYYTTVVAQSDRLYTKNLEENSAKCLESILKGDIRYFAEVLLANLQDDKTNERRPAVERTERLTGLAKKYGEITFNSEVIGQKTLEIFINESKLLPLVGEHLAKQTKAIKVETLVTQANSTLSQTQSNILITYGIEQMRNGDPNAFINTIQQFYTLSSYESVPASVRQLINSTETRLLNFIQQNDFLKTWTVQQAAAAASVISEYLKLPAQVSNYSYQFGKYFVIFHILGNQDDAIDKVYNSFSSDVQQRLLNNDRIDQLNHSLARYLSERNLTLQQRLDIIGRFYQTEQVQYALKRENTRDITSVLTNTGLLTAAEIESNRAILVDLFIQKKQIAQFLKAAKFDDFNIRPDESAFSQYVSGLLNSTMWQDANLCSKILVKADSMVKQAKSAGQWTSSTSSDTDFVSSILLRRDQQSYSIADLGLLVALTRDANGPQLVINPDFLQRLFQTMPGKYRQLFPSDSDRLKAIKNFYELVGPYFGKGDASGLAGLWMTILQGNIRNQQEINSIIEWANQQSQTGSYPQLSRQIYISALQFTILPPSRGGMPGGIGGRGALLAGPTSGGFGGSGSTVSTILSEEQNNYIRDYYFKVLADSELSSIWRLMAVRNLIQAGNLDKYPAVVLKSIPVVIEVWKRYSYLPDVYYEPLVLQFVQLQNEPGWAELAGELSEAYKQYMEKSGIKKSTPPLVGLNHKIFPATSSTIQNTIILSVLTNGLGISMGGGIAGRGPGPSASGRSSGLISGENMAGSRAGTPSQNNSLTLPKAMLELRLMTNQDELVREQIENCDEEFGSSLDIWVLLVQYGKDSLLAHLIEKYCTTVGTRSESTYTKLIEKNLIQCLKSISKDDIRYFAEVLLSSLADSKVKEQMPETSHKQRLVRLARQYNDIKFSQNILKQRVLPLLLSEPDALEFVSKSIAEQIAGIDMDSIFTNWNNASRDQFHLIMADCMQHLLTGNPNIFIQTAGKVVQKTSEINRNLTQELLNTMNDNLLTTADCIKSNWTAAQMAALASAATELLVKLSMLAQSSNFQLTNEDDLLAGHCVFLVLSNDANESNKTYSRFSSNLLQRLESILRRAVPSSIASRGGPASSSSPQSGLTRYYEVLAKYINNKNLSFEQRLAFVKRFYQLSWVKSTYEKGWRPNNIAETLVAQKIFTNQEIISNGSLFVELTDPSVGMLLNASKVSEINIEPGRFNSYFMEMVNNLISLDIDTALKVIIKGDTLYQKDVKPYQSSQLPRYIFTDMVINPTRSDNKLNFLTLFVKLFRDTKGHNIFPDSYFYQFDRQLASRFRDFMRASPNKLEYIQSLYQQIGPSVGRGNAAGISGIFSDIFSSMITDQSSLESIAQWASGQMQTGDYPGLAAEIKYLADAFRYRQSSPGNRLYREKNQAVIQHYKDGLNDPNLPLQWQLMTVGAFERWLSYPTYNQLALDAIAILAKSSSVFPEFSWDTNNNIWTSLIQSRNTEGWQVLATNVLNAYIEHNNPDNSLNRGMSINLSEPYGANASAAELAMLETSLILGNQQAAEKILASKNSNLQTSSCTPALLINYNNKTLFDSFVQKNGENIRLDSRGQYTASTDENQISIYLQNVSREDLRYYLNVLLNAHRDYTRTGQVIRVRRDERLANLAQKFPKIKFQNAALQKQALLLLTVEAGTLPYIENALAEQAKNFDLSAFVSEYPRNTTDNMGIQLFIAHQLAKLLKGDANSLSNTIHSILNVQNAPSSPFIYTFMSKFIQLISGAKWSDKNIHAFLKIADELLSVADLRNFSSDAKQILCSKIVFLLLSGRDGEIEPLIKDFISLSTVPPNNTTMQPYNLQNIHQFLGRYMNSTDMPVDKRLEIIWRLYRIKYVADLAADAPSGYAMLTLLWNQNILSEKEIFDNIDTLTAQPMFNSSCWEILASIQERNNLLDEAEKSWEKAAQMSIKSEKQWSALQTYVVFLNRNNRLSQALEYWRSFDIQNLSEKAKSEYNTLIQRLSSNYQMSEDNN